MMRINKQFIGAIGVGVVLLGAVFWHKTRGEAFWNEPTPTVSLKEAVGTVLAANPGTVAVDATLERENGGWAWEVELDNDLEVYIDAETNQIVKTEQGWDLGDVPVLSGFLLPN
ncbi:MAG: PepSY domain-containing protein [Leptolyngbyaceae cyanobacterium RM2_2_4]|nr:PepSY domain-containing protein [Leptolyngbyaceae cyanobacterium SM1_4_3]NJO50789.1 PepSY domain-containing protein [Leptolyngbyaceae cyanobacterium RM2_2_4]